MSEEQGSPLRLWLRRQREGRNRAELARLIRERGPSPTPVGMDGQRFEDDTSHPLHPDYPPRKCR